MCARRSVAELVNTEIFRCIVVVAWQECECVYPQDPPAQQTYPFTAEAASGSARSIRTRITFILFQSNLYVLFAPSVFASSQHTRCLHLSFLAPMFLSLWIVDAVCFVSASSPIGGSLSIFILSQIHLLVWVCPFRVFREVDQPSDNHPPHPLSPIQPKPNRL